MPVQTGTTPWKPWQHFPLWRAAKNPFSGLPPIMERWLAAAMILATRARVLPVAMGKCQYGKAKVF